MANKKEYIYPLGIRIWHWLQALSILILIYTGLEVHGTINTIGFETARNIHNFFAWFFIILEGSALVGFIVTGEYKQYKPTFEKVKDLILYYSFGIFKGETHPYHKTKEARLNPLQRFTYIGVFFLIFIQIISGIYYYYYNELPILGLSPSLQTIATIHFVVGMLIFIFVIAHIYLATTGKPVTKYIIGMITGYEPIDE